MRIAPAVFLGILVVFGIGYVLALLLFSNIEEKIEGWIRKRTGRISSINQTTLNVDLLAIAGGVLAVVLLLALLFTGSSETQVSIWYLLTGIGIIAGLLTFVVFRHESPGKNKPEAAKAIEAWPSSMDGQEYEQQPGKDETGQNPPQLKENLYRKLLLKTRNDKALADRLIEYERKRNPTASEEELIRSAIERWELDNR